MRKVWIIIKGIFALVVLALVIGPQWPAFGDQAYQIETIVEGRYFDFPSWLTEATAAKLAADVSGSHRFLSEGEQVALVRAYVEELGELQQREQELEREVAGSASAADLEALAENITERRSALARRQLLVESILQDQVAAVLLDEGFGIGGRIWPPVRMRLTPLPTLLIVSPREEIRQIQSLPLPGGVTATERTTLEGAVAGAFDVSAYITNIGGLGVYPTMVIESANLPFLIEVVAHEWAHNWFNQYPIGLNYGASGEIRVINESAAGLFGREIARKVLIRYYPDLLPPEPTNPPAAPLEPAEPPPPAFDFRAEMRETRIRVDAFLAAGNIEAAEAYMERRRQVFVENGYPLRVLNQAYFAFHGAYADRPGAAGAGREGPRVVELRERLPSLHRFMLALRFVTSFEELQAAIEAAG